MARQSFLELDKVIVQLTVEKTSTLIASLKSISGKHGMVHSKDIIGLAGRRLGLPRWYLGRGRSCRICGLHRRCQAGTASQQETLRRP